MARLSYVLDGREVVLSESEQRHVGSLVSSLLVDLEQSIRIVLDGRAAEEPNPEACPGCGCLPGDGVSESCDDPNGCGFFRELAADIATKSDDDLKGGR